MIEKPSTAKETGSMKNLALVAVLLGVVSLPAFAQNKYIKNANPKLIVPEAIAPVPVEKDKQVDQEKQADEREGAAEAEATVEAATEAPATAEATTDADPATGESATDAAGQEAVNPNGKPSGL